MLTFCCLPGSAPHQNGQSKRRRSGKTLTVDIHCHISTPECEPLVRELFSAEKEPFVFFATAETREVNRRLFATMAAKMTSPEERLKDMDRMGIDIQVISPSPNQYYYWTEGALGLQLARMQNERVAEIVHAYPTRFVGTVQELERVVKELGLQAVEISTNVNGADFDDPRFEPVFARAEELGVLLFIHPIGCTAGERMRDYYLINIVGHPLESTVAVSRLIFGGVLERHPHLKICVAHGGGYLPFYAGRMDHAYQVRPECQHMIQRPPSTYLRQLYFDTVLYTAENLVYLVKQVGGDHVLLGTDYPADMGEADPLGYIGKVRSLSREDKVNICGGNAARLLRLAP
jgi:aminocarboxymuconate-semialdehyde decarboxylase